MKYRAKRMPTFDFEGYQVLRWAIDLKLSWRVTIFGLLFALKCYR